MINDKIKVKYELSVTIAFYKMQNVCHPYEHINQSKIKLKLSNIYIYIYIFTYK